jgi:hypothetical protein
MRKIVVNVAEDGATTTDYISFEGTACLAESERFHALLAQLGIQVETVSTMPKPELLTALRQQEVTTSELQQSEQQGGTI